MVSKKDTFRGTSILPLELIRLLSATFPRRAGQHLTTTSVTNDSKKRTPFTYENDVSQAF
jgi:hypothetical protein